MSFKQYKYEKELTDLQKKESPDGSTCLISLYVPPDRAIAAFVQELTEEIGTATNIRSKFTQKNVVSALRTVIGKLKLYGNKSPSTGIVFFAGATSDSGHKDFKIESYVFEPPEPVSRKLYVCDNRFHVEHLLDRMVEKELYALLAIDSAKATIATLKGGNIEIIKSTRSGAAKKHRKGGQSSVRFARLREEAVARFMKRVADELKNFFIEAPDKNLKGIIVGGPGQIKEQVIEYFDKRLKDKLIGIKDLGYGGDQSGIRELVSESQDLLEGVSIMEEKKLVRQFLDAMMANKANYGEKEVRENLKMGAVDTLLVSKGLNLLRMKSTCLNCSFLQEATIKFEEESNYISEIQKTSCPKCNTLKWDIEKKDLILNLGYLAEETGARTEIISDTTEEGRQIQSFGGICAILRYEIEH
ncbi:MAG: peptide chain release factor 1 [Candidatus Heimdallarchaeota archaeon]|nr:peptide chain release factor 1 [Candidatus Heimdallarchaeota archaeon]